VGSLGRGEIQENQTPSMRLSSREFPRFKVLAFAYIVLQESEYTLGFDHNGRGDVNTKEVGHWGSSEQVFVKTRVDCSLDSLRREREEVPRGRGGRVVW